MLKIESWFYSEKLDHFIKLTQSLKINICKCNLEKLSKYLLSLYHYLHQKVNNNYENYETLAPTAIVFLRGRTKNLKCINLLCDIKQHNKKSFRFKSKTFFFTFHLYIYSPDSQESSGGAIHRASNYPDLLPEMPRYCCPVKIFYLVL